MQSGQAQSDDDETSRRDVGPNSNDKGSSRRAAPTEVASTLAYQQLDVSPDPDANRQIPTSLGRYVVRRRVAEGGHGTVFIGEDSQLHRIVAIKVPHEDRLRHPGALQQFQEEAKHLAQLRHPGIVTVHDVGVQDGLCYIVTDHVDGTTLTEWLKAKRPDWQETARIVSSVAETLAYAHAHRIVHRDVKPSNIMLDKNLSPVLVDFGLALSEAEVSRPRPGRVLGTPGYMSPEQARGEGHRIDGRTDVYSLGVVLYRMLCGRLPFTSTDEAELRRQVLEDEPQPPRQIDPRIPIEMERICLKAMAKRVSDRYFTASDMAEELRQAAVIERPIAPPSATPLAHTPQLTPGSLGTPGTPSGASYPLRIVPKGLRAFGPEDADFYVALLPGPRGSDGLPDSIRFWKTRIETHDGEPSFCVGLMYGPSGCGKSSLVRAGLLPRIADSTVCVYVEATRDDTEQRLTRALCRACPRLESSAPLSQSVASLRRSHGADDRKLLVVLDQFEQWLHAHSSELSHSELVAAMRQADGRSVQFLLLIRDDFWVAVTRLFENLEIPLDRDRNTRLVDLFDQSHAKRVLMAFGHAFGQLPDNATDLSVQEKGFLERAINELSQDERVIPVHLSLFAELMKGRPWTTSSLDQVGGTRGVGVTFLSETFSARTAVPEHRAMERPARAVLQALLPESGSNIKGYMRSRSELAAACGLPESSARFSRLIQILDQELHIITPTESDALLANAENTIQSVTGIPRAHGASEIHPGPVTDPAAGPPATSGALYQLTHDYLVPPLRHWLNLERRRTWRGRAQLALEQRAAQMQQWPQSHFLPSPAEYVSILFGVRRKNRTPEQQRLMRHASRHYGLRWGGSLAALVMGAILLQQYVGSVSHRESEAARRELQAAVFTTVGSIPSEMTRRVADLPNNQQSHALLRDILRNDSADQQERLHAAFCLLHLNGILEPDALHYMVQAIPSADTNQCTNFVSFLTPVSDSVKNVLLDRCMNSELDRQSRGRYATILLSLGDRRGAEHILKLRADPADRTEFIHRVFPTWHAPLASLKKALDDHGIMQDDEDAAAFRSGLCAAIGLIPAAKIDDQTFVTGLLTRFAQEAPDGGTRSAADFAIRRLGGSAPLPTRSRGPVAGRHWFVNSHDMIMVEIPAGSLEIGSGPDRREIHIEQPFFMEDREVSYGLFKRFYEEFAASSSAMGDQYRWLGPQSRYLATEAPEEGPATNMTWYGAVQFCNWLSETEGRLPFYQITERKEKLPLPQTQGGGEVECDIWDTVRTANGYRLPEAEQWQYACASRSTGLYCFGNDPSLLSSFALITGSGRLVLERCASRLPNAWGLFDMHGNAPEWCTDALEGKPAQRANADPSLHSPPERAKSTSVSGKHAALGGETLGFRVLCPR